MGAILNGKEIHGGFLNGKLLFEELDDSQTWLQCPTPSNVPSGANVLKGMTLMRYNDGNKSIDIVSNAKGGLTNLTVGFQLPSGYEFDESSDRVSMKTCVYDNYGTATDTSNIVTASRSANQYILSYQYAYSIMIYLCGYAGEIRLHNDYPVFSVVNIKGVHKV